MNSILVGGLSVCLSVFQPNVCLTDFPSACPSVCLFTSVYQSACLFACLPASACRPDVLCLFICLSVGLYTLKLNLLYAYLFDVLFVSLPIGRSITTATIITATATTLFLPRPSLWGIYSVTRICPLQYIFHSLSRFFTSLLFYKALLI